MPYQNGNPSVSAFRDHNLSCPECGSEKIVTETIDHRFSYGQENSAVELSARIPVRRCEECGSEFFDYEAEDLMHEAVCRHLHVMTPSEVRSIRQQHGNLSRAEFARVTRLGEATIGRWERGALIQNAAYDQLLYLLTFTENLIRLQKRIEIEIAEPVESPKAISVSTQRFRSISPTPSLMTEAASFDLIMATPGVV